jgi:hypothetical protein
MPALRAETLRELVSWEPGGGVVSVYVAIDPGDRSEGWRIELRNRLRDLAAEGGDSRERRALAATTQRALEHLPDEAPLPSGRTQIGFLEVADRGGADRWLGLQLPLERTIVAHAPRPVVAPLAALVGRAQARGIAAVSAERVRLFRWELGWLEELEDWEIEIFSRDWRERKSQRPGDPARAQGTSSSGRDQYGQRLEHNRERFLKEAGRLAARRIEPAAAEILAFGDREHVGDFAAGAGDRVVPGDDRNLISLPLGEVEGIVHEVITSRERECERELARRIADEAGGGSLAAAGLQETLQALAEGRVEHLIYDPAASFEAEGDGLPPELGLDLTHPAERMVELAVETSARVTVADEEIAPELAPMGGVVALLRY